MQFLNNTLKVVSYYFEVKLVENLNTFLRQHEYFLFDLFIYIIYMNIFIYIALFNLS